MNPPELLLSTARLLSQQTSPNPKHLEALKYAAGQYSKLPVEDSSQAFSRIGLRGAEALDLGSGSGHLSLALAAHFDRVVGIDPSEEYVDIAKLVASNHPQGSKTNFLRGIAEKLPFEDNRFDTVISCGVLMFTDHEAAFREIARVLKPGGTFYLFYSGPGWYLRYMLDLGISSKNQNRTNSGAQVILNQFLWEEGIASSQGNPEGGFDQWLTYDPFGIERIAECFNLEMLDNPSWLPEIRSFLGITATFDRTFRKANRAPGCTLTVDGCLSAGCHQLALGLATDAPLGIVERALIMVQAGLRSIPPDRQMAWEIFQEHLADKPGLEELEGKLHLANRRPVKALQILGALPRNERTLCLLGCSCLQMNDFALAEQHFASALERNSSFLPAWAGFIKALSGQKHHTALHEAGLRCAISIGTEGSMRPMSLPNLK